FSRDWSSDVCSSDLYGPGRGRSAGVQVGGHRPGRRGAGQPHLSTRRRSLTAQRNFSMRGAPVAPAGIADADQAVVESDIATLQALMARGVLNSQALVRACLRRVAAYDQQGPALNAIAALHPDALRQARELDAERAAGRLRGPLHGIPLLVKDNFHVAGLPTSAGTLALADWGPGPEAGVVRRLRAAGAVILGKTTLHELACGIINISSLTGQTRNPYAPGRAPGGSSGGTAAAVAGSFAAAGLGSDTSGSIRVPAAANNLVGLRPTRGLASRAGI